MAESLDKATITNLLADLKGKDPKRRVFGSSEHDYKLNPPLAVSVIEEFETRQGIRLPEDYRYFMTEIGDGGAGPCYGLFPFGQHDDSLGLRTWENGDLVGDLSQPFPHSEAWNLDDEFCANEPDPPEGISQDDEDRLLEEWDKVLEANYWNSAIMNGAIPISHLGCALRQWLVVNGEQRGFVWDDMRADNGGLAPLRDSKGTQMTFTNWYVSWLNELLRNAHLLGVDQRGSRRHDLLLALLLIVAGALIGVAIALTRN